MGRHSGKSSTLFTEFAYCIGWKQRPIPAPQTSLILELPNELILSILSHVSPDPRLAGQYARLRIRCRWRPDDYHRERVEFLRPLSMTCRAMRLRLLPWVWERLVLLPPHNLKGKILERKLDAIANTLRADIFLATSVRFVTAYLPWDGTALPSFVKCLKSLPNLHTLEIRCWEHNYITTPLEKALKGVKLPQIKTLVIPPAAHPLLRHCCGVEDVVRALDHRTLSPDGFFASLASMRNSKVKRLTIPRAPWDNQSQFVAACPRLTELTIVCPPSLDARITKSKTLSDPIGSTRLATSQLITACKALPDFDTLEIVYYPVFPRSPICWCGESWCLIHVASVEQDQGLKEHMMCAKNRAIECLKGQKTACQEIEGGKRTTLRVIELTREPLRPMFYRGSMKVEEYEV